MKTYHRGLIDLHLHLDGSLSMDSVKRLAALKGVQLPDDETLLQQLQVQPDCRSLNEYLEKFAFPCSLLQSEEAISLAVQTLCEELQEQGLIYAEIRFAPQLHLLEGLTQDKVVAAACEGLHRTDFPAGLILCCMRGNDNREENLVTVRMTEKYLGRGVCACDLAGAEALFPTKDFKELFDLAKELGVPYTIHAGEADGPESVRCALSYGTKRLGHGVRSIEDPALVEELAQKGIALECCPTSNLQTCMFPSYEAYPLKDLLAKGLRVTVNTDNMMVSGVTLSYELEKL
ncbi:MAG: adenosine deaminase, partial [Clostridia bacterium]|nr:adenosine deaminase [Clostridia bacterium]